MIIWSEHSVFPRKSKHNPDPKERMENWLERAYCAFEYNFGSIVIWVLNGCFLVYKSAADADADFHYENGRADRYIYCTGTIEELRGWMYGMIACANKRLPLKKEEPVYEV